MVSSTAMEMFDKQKLQQFLPFLIAGGILVLAVGGYLTYRLVSGNKTAATNPNDPKPAQAEVKKLVEEVGKILDLPRGEDPTAATVTDIEKLKDQAFFAKAKNGDKVLIYAQAKKAILYDPLAKKVLEVASLNIGSQSAAQTQIVKIALKNGTTSSGLTSRVEPEITKAIPSGQVIFKDNAASTDYPATLVVVLNESAKAAAGLLAKQWKVNLSSLPAGETKPDGADILVILGKDRT